MRSILLTWTIRILLWVLAIYLIAYFLIVHITEKNVFWVSVIHLFLVLFSVMLMTGIPGENIEGY